MPKPNGEPKGSAGSKLDRRAVIRAALVAGGVAALGTGKAAAMPQGAFVGEREWARVLARHIANQLPEAARQIPDLCLSADQLQQLRRAFENTLITNMGCENPPGQ
jgi:hypothetical protein